MDSHGIARKSGIRTEEQKRQDLDKIQKYRQLDDQVRASRTDKTFTHDAFQRTSRLLRLNPEYYTAWNDRKRLLTSGLLSARSGGSWPSRASPTSSRTATTTPSSAVCSSSSSTATPPAPASRTAGRSGITADGATAQPAAAGGSDDRVSRAGGGDAAAAAAAESADAGPAGTDDDAAVLRAELAFTIPLLMEFPKCYWIWNYRTWLLEQAVERLAAAAARRIWEEELGLASKMLTKDRRNFHAWGYRRNVVGRLESPELEGESMAEAEFAYTTKMIHVDLSNFSAWHNRSKLIPRLLDERGASEAERQTFYDEELGMIREALNVGPEDQSLWYYHHSLMLNLTEYIGRSTITPNFSVEERVTYLTREIELIKELLEDYDDIKWVYEALLEYTVGLAALERREATPDERRDLADWLEKLRSLDPMRNGRWNDVEVAHGLERHSSIASA